MIKMLTEQQLFNADALDKLWQQIEAGYVLFKPYRFGHQIGVCTDWGLSAQSLQILRSMPLRELPANVLYDYLDATENEIAILLPQIKYLLPRILELFVQNAHLRLSKEIIFDKLHIEKIGLWQPKEIEFLQQFFLTAFAYNSTLAKPYYSIQEFLCILDCAGLDYSALKTYWLSLIEYPKIAFSTAELLWHFPEKVIWNYYTERAIEIEWWQDERSKEKLLSVFIDLLNSEISADERNLVESGVYFL